MKSSIFNSDKGPSLTPVSKTKLSRSTSNNLRTNNQSINNGKTKTFTWNLDELISSYQDTGSLPPILSPTLPNAENSGVGSSQVKKDISKKKKEMVDNDQIPLSMLSPTLPPAFDDSKRSMSHIQQPIPRKPIPRKPIIIKEDVHSSASSMKAKIRWINKMNDSTKPKFLLRIVFDNKKKYKEKLIADENLTGLGISTIDVPINSNISDINSKSKADKAGLASFTDKEKDKKSMISVTNISNKRVPNSIEKESNKVRNSLSEREIELNQKENALKLREKILLENQNKLKAILENQNNNINSMEIEENKIADVTRSTNKPQNVDKKNSIMTRKLHWLKLAKDCKLASERSNDIASIIMEIDAILMFIISYDYDEKLRVIGKVLPSGRYWNSLDDDITKLIKKTGMLLKTQESAKVDFLRFLICLLYLTKSSILKRINSILIKVIDSYIKKSNNKEGNESLTAKIIELQQTTIHNFGLMSEYMQESQPNELYSYISNRFPKTWANRTIDIEISQSESGDMVPSNSKYYLPVGVYSNLHEMSGLLFSFLSEYMTNQLNSSKIEYSLQSGKI